MREEGFTIIPVGHHLTAAIWNPDQKHDNDNGHLKDGDEAQGMFLPCTKLLLQLSV